MYSSTMINDSARRLITIISSRKRKARFSAIFFPSKAFSSVAELKCPEMGAQVPLRLNSELRLTSELKAGDH
jgi:hypothetical protein